MIALVHQHAPDGMVAVPNVVATMEPSETQISRAVDEMGSDQFMLILSRSVDVDALTDPDALYVEFGDGHGFMLYQRPSSDETGSPSWQSKSAENLLINSTINSDDVLEIISAYASGLRFDEFVTRFPDV